jgi:LPXTG-site transpeptidase (sortase) family protein
VVHVRLALLILLFAVAVVLPWLLPAVPRGLGDLVPDSRPPVVSPDPPVVRSTPPSSSPGVTLRPSAAARLDGRRLPSAGPPEQVVVRRLGVRSAVVPISGDTGVLLPPADPQLLGWWREGAVPGAARGTAVLTGHTVHTGGGAFDHLRGLVAGDRVRVRTTRGTIGYSVVDVHVYTKRALARSSDRVFRLTGPGRLVLVTCSDWNGADYDTNTVVTARPVHSTARR